MGCPVLRVLCEGRELRTLYPPKNARAGHHAQAGEKTEGANALRSKTGGWPRPSTSPARPAKWVPRSFAFFAKGRVPRRLALAKPGAVTTMQADGMTNHILSAPSYPPLPRTQGRGTRSVELRVNPGGRMGHPPSDCLRANLTCETVLPSTSGLDRGLRQAMVHRRYIPQAWIALHL